MKTGVSSVTDQDHKTDNAASERRTVLRKRPAGEATPQGETETAGEGGGVRRRFLPGTMRPKKTLEEVLAMRHARLARLAAQRGEDATPPENERQAADNARRVPRPENDKRAPRAAVHRKDKDPAREKTSARRARSWQAEDAEEWQNRPPRRGRVQNEDERARAARYRQDDGREGAPRRGRAQTRNPREADWDERPARARRGGGTREEDFDARPPRRARASKYDERPRRDDRPQRDERPRREARPAAHKSAESAPLSREGVRLSRLMSQRGLCSRREADELIERGWVCVDGVPVDTLGIRVSPQAEVTLLPEAERGLREQVTILLNKPVGYVSGQPEDGYPPAVALISAGAQYDPQGRAPRFHRGHLRGLAPAGRLDIDSTGLLVLTQNGRIARRLIGEHSEVSKEYRVWVNGEITAQALAQLTHGLTLDGRKLRRATVRQTDERELRFILNEGRKRQIRRMCELVGLHVTRLQRIRVGRIWLDDLPLGQWRYLRPDEHF